MSDSTKMTEAEILASAEYQGLRNVMITRMLMSGQLNDETLPETDGEIVVKQLRATGRRNCANG